MNRHEGRQPRVLCVCSAGLLRAPTAAFIGQRDFGWNTRAAGAIDEYALVPVTSLLITWSDAILAMEEMHRQILQRRFPGMPQVDRIHVLGIEDKFARMDEGLVERLRGALLKAEQELGLQ